MNYSLELLDAAKKELGSDYKAAQIAVVSRQYVSQIRNKGAHFNGAQAARLAKALGKNPTQAALLAESDKVQNDSDKSLLKKLANIAASVILSLTLLSGMSYDSISYAAESSIKESNQLYIMPILYIPRRSGIRYSYSH